jgi:hypothetical protein
MLSRWNLPQTSPGWQVTLNSIETGISKLPLWAGPIQLPAKGKAAGSGVGVGGWRVAVGGIVAVCIGLAGRQELSINMPMKTERKTMEEVFFGVRSIYPVLVSIKRKARIVANQYYSDKLLIAMPFRWRMLWNT